MYSNIELYEDCGSFFVYDKYLDKSFKIVIYKTLIKSNSVSLEKYLDDVYEDIKYELGIDFMKNYKWNTNNMIKLLPPIIKHVNEIQEEKRLGKLKKAIVIEMMYS